MAAYDVFSSHMERSVTVEQDIFGTTKEGEQVKRYRFTNQNGVQMEVIELGVILTSLRVPDKHGQVEDIVLGFDNLEGYYANPYFGAIIGRFANRINKGEFTLDGVTYELSKNEGENQVHGGVKAWCHRVWESHREGNHVVFSYFSPDGDAGYPGDVRCDVTIQLTDDNEVIVTMTAEALSTPTPVNVAWHPYFNLAGEGSANIYDHELTIFADKFIPYRAKDLISTGEVHDVTGKDCDFRKPKTLGPLVRKAEEGSMLGTLFNVDYPLRGPQGKRLATRLVHPASGRVMELYTNESDLEFYTGDFLDAKGGKNGHDYGTHSGIILMTQNSTDACNHPNLPDSILRQGSTYCHKMWHKFSVVSE